MVYYDYILVLNVKGGIILELDTYEINSETLAIIPFSKGKSKVYEIGGEYIVSQSPLSIIKHSCLYFGCSYDGRREGAKTLLGVEMKVPILIEESRNIIFFPVSSCINKDSIWISYHNLFKYVKIDDRYTMLYFKESRVIKLEAKYNLIDNQIIRCIKLDSFLIKRKNFIRNEYQLLQNLD